MLDIRKGLWVMHPSPIPQIHFWLAEFERPDCGRYAGNPAHDIRAEWRWADTTGPAVGYDDAAGIIYFSDPWGRDQETPRPTMTGITAWTHRGAAERLELHCGGRISSLLGDGDDALECECQDLRIIKAGLNGDGYGGRHLPLPVTIQLIDVSCQRCRGSDNFAGWGGPRFLGVQRYPGRHESRVNCQSNLEGEDRRACERKVDNGTSPGKSIRPGARRIGLG